MPKITRAILSCYDKTGIVELAEALTSFGVEIITTEGTHRALDAAGINSTKIGDFTGIREMLGGRVKTLHPKVHAGLLGIRDNKLHCEEMNTNEFQWVDMIVTNLHPIEKLVSDPVASAEEVIEQVDIGGIAMVRSAAKNFRYVTVVVNPERYSTLIHELQAHDVSLPFTTRYELAQEAFSSTAKYDETLAGFLHDSKPPEE